MSKLEKMFGQCVEELGGDVLPPFNNAPCADFLFRDDDVILEMKIFEKDFEAEHRGKMQVIVNGWHARQLVPPDQALFELGNLPPLCQREWLNIVLPPVERVIRDANRQIRSTKKHLKLEAAKGILLVANEGNHMFTDPMDFIISFARVSAKKTSDGALRFPHVESVIFFSDSIPDKISGVPFWFPAHMHREDEALQGFVKKLKEGWYAYLGRKTGVRMKFIQAPQSRIDLV